jgi:hypothetical protein
VNEDFRKRIEKIATKEITRAEQSDLLKVARLREKVAKTAVIARSAQLRAEFEQQISAHYSFCKDEVWQEITREVDELTKKAQERVSQRSRELGIPEAFAPEVNWYWNSDGDRATKGRIAELRAIAATQIEAIGKEAKMQIEAASADVQTKLLASGLKSAEASAFLESMPTIEALMPPLQISSVENLLDGMGYYEKRKLLRG